MKAYRVNDGEMYETDVPDGALLLEVGSKLDPSGDGELPPIVAIDHVRKTYRREGWPRDIKVPSRVIHLRDLTWSRRS